MSWSRLYKFGDEGYVRRFPVALHFLLSGVTSAMLILMQPEIRPLVVAFNDGNLGIWGSLLAAVIGVPMYMFFFLYLASTKAVLDWLLDGK